MAASGATYDRYNSATLEGSLAITRHSRRGCIRIFLTRSRRLIPFLLWRSWTAAAGRRRPAITAVGVGSHGVAGARAGPGGGVRPERAGGPPTGRGFGPGVATPRDKH